MQPMNTNQAYLTFAASNWPSLSQQVKAAVSDCWHRHAGRWQPETISLYIATRLLSDAAQPAQAEAQREAHLPLLATWLRQQCHAVTLLGDHNLQEHRLYLNPPTNVRR